MKNALKLIAIMLFAWAMASCTKDPNNGGSGSYGRHEYVDLGLPSGTLWATCNVGANNPEDFGDYFAWGETSPKDDYSGDTYRYSIGWHSHFSSNLSTINSLTKYCNNSECGYNGFTDTLTILQPTDDAATANWGNGWRMPTVEECWELFHYCTLLCTTQNGVNGMRFTGPNGNTLFLPAAGLWDSDLDYAGSWGYYYSSAVNTDDPGDAKCIEFAYAGTGRPGNLSRYLGSPIRPVRSR